MIKNSVVDVKEVSGLSYGSDWLTKLEEKLLLEYFILQQWDNISLNTNRQV